MKNAIRVGVKPITQNGYTPESDADGEVIAALQVHWAEVDGVRVPGEILAVDWHADGESINEVTIRLACSSFATDPDPYRYSRTVAAATAGRIQTVT